MKAVIGRSLLCVRLKPLAAANSPELNECGPLSSRRRFEFASSYFESSNCLLYPWRNVYKLLFIYSVIDSCDCSDEDTVFAFNEGY